MLNKEGEKALYSDKMSNLILKLNFKIRTDVKALFGNKMLNLILKLYRNI